MNEVFPSFVSSLSGACSEPLGVGWNFSLPDSAFKASSRLATGWLIE